jgi:hypothetical protein
VHARDSETNVREGASQWTYAVPTFAEQLCDLYLAVIDHDLFSHKGSAESTIGRRHDWNVMVWLLLCLGKW